MIQYALKCSQGHSFDSWFQSAAAYDKLASAGMVACAVCGNGQVEKAIMTPRVRPARDATPAPVEHISNDAARPLTAPVSEAEQALEALRCQVEANSDYVGADFASEARKIHLGDAPERSIYGEARLDDAKALIEDGISVAPLPFVPNRRTN